MGKCTADKDLFGDAGGAHSSEKDKLLFDGLGEKNFSAGSGLGTFSKCRSRLVVRRGKGSRVARAMSWSAVGFIHGSTCEQLCPWILFF